ncbi:MAG TPA: NAD(P)/FAD-dependent oxidoreductase [bacterium]|nr:NAD(P)/FAD-dependent oxidoreductase [bacterium]
MEKKIIVIGGGIAGLAVGCYARMNGYGALLFELNDKPGGLCTSWTRKGYLVDGCLHWLVGSGPAARGLHQCWLELGALQGRKFLDHEIYITVRGKDGKVLNVYTDTDRFEAHLKELSPQDAPVIEEFAALVRRLGKVDMDFGKPKEIQTWAEKLAGLAKIMPFIMPFMKYEKVSIQEFAKRFKDPFLREAFAAPFDLPDFPLLGVAFSYAWMNNKSAGYPIGGSLALARAIEKRFLDLGGKVHYKARVEKVLVEGGRAVGIRLVGGAEHRADGVVSAADGRATIFDMLEGKFVNDEIREYYKSLPRFRPLIQASFGVDRDLRGEPEMAAYELEEPMTIAGEEQKYLTIHNYSCDPTTAPPGKSVLVIRLMSDYDNWKKLAADKGAYEEEKEKVGNSLMGFLESRYPGISEQVEMLDVATPLTFERYTANWEGSMEGWLMTTKTMRLRMKKTLPGLNNFYMAGQWVSPGGGLPGCAITAKEVMHLICHADGRAFQTSVP